MRFTDKICIVSGGGSGIGRATCMRFAAEGGKVTVVDLNEDHGNETVANIAKAGGVGMGTIYRHVPTRADLIIAVYRHRVEACAEGGPALLASRATPYEALRCWVDLFVDFLSTKHGLAATLQSGDPRFAPLHAYFLERLVPACAVLLDAAAAAGEVPSAIGALESTRPRAAIAAARWACRGPQAGRRRSGPARGRASCSGRRR